MSSRDRAKKRQARQSRKAYAKPSLPRMIGANDNHANDNAEPVTIRGVNLTDNQVWRFHSANERIKSEALEVRRVGHQMLAKLDAEITERLRQEAVDRGLDEQRRLERLRGLEIGVSTQSGCAGAPRAARDGLETLLTAGSISRTQHAAGMRYRKDYELIDPERGLTPPALDQTRAPARGGEGFAKRKAERERFVRDLEAMIQAEDRTFRGALGRSDVERIGRAVWALREIAGKGSNLMGLTGSGSVRAVTVTALQDALDCAAIAYGLE